MAVAFAVVALVVAVAGALYAWHWGHEAQAARDRYLRVVEEIRAEGANGEVT